MIVAIAANGKQKEALAIKGFSERITLTWVSGSYELLQQPDANLLIDCLFSGEQAPKTTIPIFIHSPVNTLNMLNATGKVARFCAWNSFTERAVWEMAVPEQNDASWLPPILENLGWQFQLVKDEPGLIAPRVISMIINEAFFALEDEVSSKEDIDTAMKLGTNYPYGPFEWAEKAGLKNIHSLLLKLSEIDSRYSPSALMVANL